MMSAPVYYEQAIAAAGSLMESVRDVVFPQYSLVPEEDALESLRTGLQPFAGEDVARGFAGGIARIRALIESDAEAVRRNDPAARDIREVVFCYPSVTALLHYRAAHLLHTMGVGLLPRMITERAHSLTGIDIHPGAVIGGHFAIDHGTGVVIGETCIIGQRVTLYQGVTLGARNFRYDADGIPMNVPRHPVIEDDVTVYSNASILGRITIGRASVIGGNVWLTHSVPPGSRILQGKIQESFSDGAGI